MAPRRPAAPPRCRNAALESLGTRSPCSSLAPAAAAAWFQAPPCMRAGCVPRFSAKQRLRLRLSLAAPKPRGTASTAPSRSAGSSSRLMARQQPGAGRRASQAPQAAASDVGCLAAHPLPQRRQAACPLCSPRQAGVPTRVPAVVWGSAHAAGPCGADLWRRRRRRVPARAPLPRSTVVWESIPDRTFQPGGEQTIKAVWDQAGFEAGPAKPGTEGQVTCAPPLPPPPTHTHPRHPTTATTPPARLRGICRKPTCDIRCPCGRFAASSVLAAPTGCPSSLPVPPCLSSQGGAHAYDIDGQIKSRQGFGRGRVGLGWELDATLTCRPQRSVTRPRSVVAVVVCVMVAGVRGVGADGLCVCGWVGGGEGR